ncbi:MAG: MGMT family protein [Chloroflexi bacterium]|nr:MGMT family protein [Chloroflexota bacterium]
MPDPAAARPHSVLATVIDAPLGPIHLAATERGLAAVELATTGEAFATGLLGRFGRAVRWAPGGTELTGQSPAGPDAAARLAAASRAIADALAGDDRDLAALELDIGDRPAWDRAVLAAVRTIPRGRTRSYGDIARQLGAPGAARAVGGAVGRNPVALAIPCHRVIAGDGSLGGYGGGWWGDREQLLDLKASLLAAEGLVVRRRPSEAGAGG